MKRTTLVNTLGTAAIGLAPVIVGAETEAKPSKPNIVLVMMDDFGVGQFQPNSLHLKPGDNDPEFVKFVQGKGKRSYDPAGALKMAQRAMPFIDKLGKEGTYFNNAFSTSNLCSPSRAGLLTGSNQIKWGCYRNKDCHADEFQFKGKILAEKLHDAGYKTGFIGKWHVGAWDQKIKDNFLAKNDTQGQTGWWVLQHNFPGFRATGYIGSSNKSSHPLNNGFDYYFGYNNWECPFYNAERIWENWIPAGKQEQYNTELFTDKAINFIQKSVDVGKPFFVEVAYHAVHEPLTPPAPKKYQIFDSGSRDVDNFYAHVYAVDQGVKKIMDFIKSKGQLDNTLFFFCSDNGATCTETNVMPGNAPFHGHKGNSLQGGIRTPLIAWGPKFAKPQVCSKLVSTMDIMPTALAAAHLPIPNSADGKNLLPILSGKSKKTVRDHLFFMGIHARAWGYGRDSVIGDYEKRRDLAPGAWVVIKDDYLLRYRGAIVPGHYKDLPKGASPKFELYNIKLDPGETKNLYSAKPEIVKKLKKIYNTEVKTLPPPVKWSRKKWDELVLKD